MDNEKLGRVRWTGLIGSVQRKKENREPLSRLEQDAWKVAQHGSVEEWRMFCSKLAKRKADDRPGI